MDKEKKYFDIIDVGLFNDERGALYFMENGTEIPFKMERCFWIKGIPAGKRRGQHAHRTCGELIIAAAGEFKVSLTDGKKNAIVHLANPEKALYVPPYTWCELYDFSSDALCLCLASQTYQVEGYINSFEEYKKEVEHLSRF